MPVSSSRLAIFGLAFSVAILTGCGKENRLRRSAAYSRAGAISLTQMRIKRTAFAGSSVKP